MVQLTGRMEFKGGTFFQPGEHISSQLQNCGDFLVLLDLPKGDR